MIWLWSLWWKRPSSRPRNRSQRICPIRAGCPARFAASASFSMRRQAASASSTGRPLALIVTVPSAAG